MFTKRWGAVGKELRGIMRSLNVLGGPWKFKTSLSNMRAVGLTVCDISRALLGKND